MTDFRIEHLIELNNEKQHTCALMRLAEEYKDKVEILVNYARQDEQTSLGALQVLAEIGYPTALPALPTLLSLVAYGTRTIQYAALETLISFGTAILPHIFQLLQSSEAMQRLVDDACEAAGRWLWADQERDHEAFSRLWEDCVSVLAHHPEDVRDMLLYVLTEPMKEWWPLAIDTFARMGYPANAPAIPTLIAHACAVDGMAAGLNALRAVCTLTPDILVPYLVNILLNKETPDKTKWRIRPEDICSLLAEPALGREYAITCGPVVCTMLQITIFARQWDIRQFLMMLEKIGPACAIYALPHLLPLWHKERESEIGTRIQKLVATFDPQLLGPYQRLLEQWSLAI